MSETLTREKRVAAYQEREENSKNKVYAIVKPIVDKYDPEALLKSPGCPADEYEPECRLIAEAIVREGLNKMSEQELGNLIAFAWHFQFGHWGTEVGYHQVHRDMARELHPLLSEYERKGN